MMGACLYGARIILNLSSTADTNESSGCRLPPSKRRKRREIVKDVGRTCGQEYLAEIPDRRCPIIGSSPQKSLPQADNLPPGGTDFLAGKLSAGGDFSWGWVDPIIGRLFMGSSPSSSTTEGSTPVGDSVVFYGVGDILIGGDISNP